MYPINPYDEPDKPKQKILWQIAEELLKKNQYSYKQKLDRETRFSNRTVNQRNKQYNNHSHYHTTHPNMPPHQHQGKTAYAIHDKAEILADSLENQYRLDADPNIQEHITTKIEETDIMKQLPINTISHTIPDEIHEIIKTTKIKKTEVLTTSPTKRSN